jgi:glutathione peroxidase-family protein
MLSAINSLQKLYSKYHDQGFTVIGAPCNQFGMQEPGRQLYKGKALLSLGL